MDEEMEAPVDELEASDGDEDEDVLALGNKTSKMSCGPTCEIIYCS